MESEWCKFLIAPDVGNANMDGDECGSGKLTIAPWLVIDMSNVTGYLCNCEGGHYDLFQKHCEAFWTAIFRSGYRIKVVRDGSHSAMRGCIKLERMSKRNNLYNNNLKLYFAGEGIFHAVREQVRTELWSERKTLVVDIVRTPQEADAFIRQFCLSTRDSEVVILSNDSSLVLDQEDNVYIASPCRLTIAVPSHSENIAHPIALYGPVLNNRSIAQMLGRVCSCVLAGQTILTNKNHDPAGSSAATSPSASQPLSGKTTGTTEIIQDNCADFAYFVKQFAGVDSDKYRCKDSGVCGERTRADRNGTYGPSRHAALLVFVASLLGGEHAEVDHHHSCSHAEMIRAAQCSPQTYACGTALTPCTTDSTPTVPADGIDGDGGSDSYDAGVMDASPQSFLRMVAAHVIHPEHPFRTRVAAAAADGAATVVQGGANSLGIIELIAAGLIAYMVEWKMVQKGRSDYRYMLDALRSVVEDLAKWISATTAAVVRDAGLGLAVSQTHKNGDDVGAAVGTEIKVCDVVGHYTERGVVSLEVCSIISGVLPVSAHCLRLPLLPTPASTSVVDGPHYTDSTNGSRQVNCS